MRDARLAEVVGKMRDLEVESGIADWMRLRSVPKVETAMRTRKNVFAAVFRGLFWDRVGLARAHSFPTESSWQLPESLYL